MTHLLYEPCNVLGTKGMRRVTFKKRPSRVGRRTKVDSKSILSLCLELERDREEHRKYNHCSRDGRLDGSKCFLDSPIFEL